MDIEQLWDLVAGISQSARDTGNGIVPKGRCQFIIVPHKDRVTLYGYPKDREEDEAAWRYVAFYPHEFVGRTVEDLVVIINGRTDDVLKDLAEEVRETYVSGMN